MLRRAGRWVAAVSIAGALFGAGWWAGRVVLEPPGDPLTGPEPVIYTIVDGTLGRSLSFTAVGEWPTEPAGTNAASGTVTAIEVDSGDQVDAGDVLYAIDLRPVTAGEGTVPAFRDLGLRTEGDDVAQLQRLLKTLGLYDGDVDGRFGDSTRSAVRAWQQQTGVTIDGVVRAGDIVFIPDLPRRVVLDEAIGVGNRLIGGEPAVSFLADEPTVRIPLARAQRELVPLTAEVIIAGDAGPWKGVITHVTERPGTDEVDLFLTAPDGGAVCGRDCLGTLPVVDVTNLPVEVVVVPETSGPTVPVAAISTDPAGRAFLTRPDGTHIEVTILAASDGLAVVDGMNSGEQIVLPLGSGTAP